jgi:hypothetical protein
MLVDGGGTPDRPMVERRARKARNFRLAKFWKSQMLICHSFRFIVSAQN